MTEPDYTSQPQLLESEPLVNRQNFYENIFEVLGIEGTSERSELLKIHVKLSVIFGGCSLISFLISCYYVWGFVPERTCFERFLASFRVSMAFVFFILNQVMLVYYDSEDRNIANRRRLALAQVLAAVLIVTLVGNVIALALINDKSHQPADYIRAALSSVLAVGAILGLAFPYLAVPKH